MTAPLLSAEPLVSLRDIEFSYGQLQVLFGVSVDVMPGEALALLGTNGAGKSTLLKVLCGLEQASSGSAHLRGEDITRAAAEGLPGKGLVLISGGRSVFPDMTVAENLEMQAFTVRKRKAWVRERTEYVLTLFPRLGERMGQNAGLMSGGEQQQLALAKALLLDPAALCIDELSLGLAPLVVQGLIEMVREVHRSGVTIVLVEQSLNIAASLCERAVFMEKGQIRFEGPTRKLVENDDIARAVFLGNA